MNTHGNGLGIPGHQQQQQHNHDICLLQSWGFFFFPYWFLSQPLLHCHTTNNQTR